MAKEVLLFFCLVVFFTCCILVVSHRIDPIDRKISATIIKKRNPFLNKIMRFFTELGGVIPTLIICALVVILPIMRNSIARQVGITVVPVVILGFFIKRIIGRVRPSGARLVEEKDPSFPSAHSMTAAALYGSIALNSLAITPSYHNTLLTVCAFLFFMIGISRVYLGIHYFTDVVGGWSLGYAAALLVNILF